MTCVAGWRKANNGPWKKNKWHVKWGKAQCLEVTGRIDMNGA